MTDRAKKLNREEKLQLQAEKLKEQAQIDLEGYVMCRSALRATRTDLHEESERYDRDARRTRCCSINAEGSESVKST
mgnify:CR=1 FL=1